MRSPKELLVASRRFASENLWVSWWCLLSTIVVWCGLIVAVFMVEAWYLRVFLGCLLGLVHVRLFVIYHDYQHGALLKNSLIVRIFMFGFGCITLSPPSVWKRSHNHHHKNNAKLYGASIGSYPVMTTTDYANASWSKRVQYNVLRHPLTIGFGYVTTFFIGMCVRPLILNPKRHWDAILSILVHLGVFVLLAFVNPSSIFYVMLIPMIIAAGLGSYLFYAQHNFPAVKLKIGRDWSHVEAALKSSSYIHMSRLFHWFTANIGYHHIHHLNHNIPFYKLPKAMAALKELSNPGVTSLRPWDVYKCLRLKLWDVQEQKLVTFRFARRQRRITAHA
ncbi:MAG: fatty acid desaturase [Planctomycetota bacterium]|nr:fatty acid desaturase [Planctomycetota bacterium]